MWRRGRRSYKCHLFFVSHLKQIMAKIQLKANKRSKLARETQKNKTGKTYISYNYIPETLEYWVGVQWGQSYLMGRWFLFSLGCPPF